MATHAALSNPLVDMAVYLAAKSNVNAERVAAAWRASWPTLLALLVGLYIVIGGLALAEAGYQDLALWLMFACLLADAVAVSWIHTGRE